MNIVHINNHDVILGGSEVVMKGEIKGLRQRGVNVFQITSGKSTVRGSKNLVIQEPLFNYSIFSLRVLIETMIWLKSKKIDVAHVHIYYGKLSNSILLALKLLKIPVVQSIHEYRRLCPNYKFLDSSGNICELCVQKSKLESVRKVCIGGSRISSLLVTLEVYFRDKLFNPNRYINHFIYVSNFIKHKHHQYLGEDNHNVLWNFSESVEERGVDKHKIYDLVYVGRLSREKGILQLLDLIDNRIRIAIIGAGPLKDIIQDKAKDSTNIDFIGFIDNDKVKSWMRRARFLVVPSLWYENNPVIVMEAFSVGLPVIGSNIGGIPEIVKDRQTGYLIDLPFSDKTIQTIRTALDMENLDYNVISKNCVEFYQENFTLDSHINKLLNIYNVIMDSEKKHLDV